ncbi:DUF6965 family protein [Ferruginibacter albus]|uniref:DUF6965 family protein n=1 Tax=Ferruginibacter albus TaxID=2875540 RepID=UPI001CC71A94|nr:DUF6371 domain-containing protein [Ferruginibacter albus]UAY51287.1 DUF6371 domain-containing protein [Ferruginibacter albus]
MNDYRFILEPYKTPSSRHTCPNCGKKREFTYYLDTQTGELLPPQYGMCNRRDKCGYHLSPYKDGYNKIIYQQERKDISKGAKYNFKKPVIKKKASFIDTKVFQSSLRQDDYEQNNFVNFLCKTFGEETTSLLISKYFIGTSNFWNGACIFWQVDFHGKIRTGKIMLYNSDNGKRVKTPKSYIMWVHKLLGVESFELEQCLFGEHLLRENLTSPVAIVESEKTAIISSLYFPEFIWLATGSINTLSFPKVNVLKGRKVLLFPDINAYGIWNEKAEKLSEFINISVSNLLETKSKELDNINGLDIADFLLRFNYKEHCQQRLSEDNKVSSSISFKEIERLKIDNQYLSQPLPKINAQFPQKLEAKSSLKEILELETFFKNFKKMPKSIKLDVCSFVNDISHFINSHLLIIKNYHTNPKMKAYLTRLLKLKDILIQKP